MPGDPQNDEPRTGKLFEMLFGGGVVVYMLGSLVTGLWWASALDTRVGAIERGLETNERRIESLDNSVLGNRLTAVETRVGGLERGIGSVDQKLDRILLRQLSGGPGRNDP